MTLMRSLRSKFNRAWRGINKQTVRAAPLPMLGGVSAVLPVTSFGSGEGQWDVPVGMIDPSWICYSVGVGRDATFEVDLANRVGCKVVSFDPTPSSIEYVKTLESIKFQFIPWAIWTNDGHLDFYSQDLNNNVNCSVIDSGRGERLCRVECYKLQTVMKRLEHPRIDLLKIDIEGAWMPVIEDMVASGIAPKVFCVEFDSPTSIWKVRKAIRLLSRVGLTLIYRRRDNYLFVQRSCLEKKA